jgi:hypothetical protein
MRSASANGFLAGRDTSGPSSGLYTNRGGVSRRWIEIAQKRTGNSEPATAALIPRGPH